jgi:hypothetical protein
MRGVEFSLRNYSEGIELGLNVHSSINSSTAMEQERGIDRILKTSPLREIPTIYLIIKDLILNIFFFRIFQEIF